MIHTVVLFVIFIKTETRFAGGLVGIFGIQTRPRRSGVFVGSLFENVFS